MNAQANKAPRKPTGVAAGLIAGVVLAAAALVAPWEGEVLTPYRDIVGKWTVCYGSTNAPMRTYTAQECQQLLETELGQYLDRLSVCVAAPVTTQQMAALLSWSYNVGTGAACSSTLMRQLNAGAPAAQWCQQLLRWDYAGGKRVRGLTNRRKAEYEVCIQ